MKVMNFAFGPGVLWPGVAKVQEEAGELQQELGKLVMVGGLDGCHWSGPLRPKIWEETADLVAALQFFVENNATSTESLYVQDRIAEKLAKFREWHEHGEDL